MIKLVVIVCRQVHQGVQVEMPIIEVSELGGLVEFLVSIFLIG
jgi:hypothetical protein